MPRYFFHVHDVEQGFDPDGVELRDADEAHSEAVVAAGEILKDIDGKMNSGKWGMRVVDEAGETVSEIQISVDKKNRRPSRSKAAEG